MTPLPVPIVDSHCHLDYPALADDLHAVLERAAEAGVRLILTIGTQVNEFDRVLALAETYEDVWCTVGTHPHNAARETDVTVSDLVVISKHPKVVGIGEAGLDHHYHHSPRDVQAKSFGVHIAAARESGLPIVIHSREAEKDTASILEEEMTRGAFKMLLHCYSSKPELARRGIAIGAYVSFSGILTYKNAEDIRATAAEIPIDRLLVETDAPYLAPVPYRGRTNEPAFVTKTLEKLAEVKRVAASELALRTNENFFRLFSKVARPAAFANAA
jgi:TatD DNase family protein